MTAGKSRAACIEGSAVVRALGPVQQLARRAVTTLSGWTRADGGAVQDDRVAEAVFLDSRIGRAFTATAGALGRAWSASKVGAGAAAARALLRSVDAVDRVRAACWVALAAAATVLALGQVASRVEPLTWTVPAAVATVAVVVMAATAGMRRT